MMIYISSPQQEGLLAKILYLAKLAIKLARKIKTFSDQQQLQEPLASKPALIEMLQEIWTTKASSSKVVHPSEQTEEVITGTGLS